MACAIAVALGAKRFFLLTCVAGMLGKSGALLTDLDREAIDGLKGDGTITGGMIPKVETCVAAVDAGVERSEEHTSELQSLMRISYAVFCLKKKNIITNNLLRITTYVRSMHTRRLLIV